jgi:hypothetical protein
MAHDQWYEAWSTALDELEADVVQVEKLLTDDQRQRDTPVVDHWNPPDGLGPLPLDLRPRADAILSRQIAATKAIAVALVVNRRHAIAAARIEVGSQGRPRPSFVDQAM